MLSALSASDILSLITLTQYSDYTEGAAKSFSPISP